MLSLLVVWLAFSTLCPRPESLQDTEALPPVLSAPRLAELYRFDRDVEGEQRLETPVFTRSGRYLVFRGDPVVAVDLWDFRLVRLPVQGSVSAGWENDDILVTSTAPLERWDLGSRSRIDVIELRAGAPFVSLSPRGDRLVCFGQFVEPDVVRDPIGGGRWPLQRTFGITTRVLWDPRANRFALASRRTFCGNAPGDGEVALVDEEGRVLRSREIDEPNLPSDWAFSPSGSRLLVATPSALELWDGESLELRLRREVAVEGLTFLDERRALVLEEGGLTLWHPPTLTRVHRLLDLQGEGLVVSPDARHLVLTSSDGERIYAIID